MSSRVAIKLPAILLAALVINAIMFVAIEYMIGNRRIRLTDTSEFDISNFIRVAEQSREVRSRRDPEAPQKPQNEMQQDLQQLASAPSAGGVAGFDVSMPDIDLGIDAGSGIAIARQLTPLVKFPAEYPMAARAKSIEGFVLLRFTVTETGAVADPEVLQAEPPGIFNRAARGAVLRWKYQPQMVDGKPTAVVSYARVNFQMLQEESQ